MESYRAQLLQGPKQLSMKAENMGLMALLAFPFSIYRQLRAGMEITDHCWKFCAQRESLILKSVGNTQFPLI